MKLKHLFRLATVLVICYSTPLSGQDLKIVVPMQLADQYQRFVTERYQFETGDTVRFEGRDHILSRLTGAVGNSGDIDIVELSQADLLKACDMGLLRKINHADLISEGDERDATFLTGTLPDCGIGTSLYSMAYAYDERAFPDKAPSTIADFFDVTSFPGKRGMRLGARYNLEMALIAAGTAPRDVYGLLATQEGLEAAFDKLMDIKDHIIWWEGNVLPGQLLLSGQAVMSTGNQGHFEHMSRSMPSLRMVMDGQIWDFAALAIPRSAAEPERAKKYLKYAASLELAKLLLQSGIADGNTRLIPVENLQQCTSGTCGCAGTNACSKSCCTSTYRQLLEDRGLLYSPVFWDRHQTVIDHRFHQQLTQ